MTNQQIIDVHAHVYGQESGSGITIITMLTIVIES